MTTIIAHPHFEGMASIIAQKNGFAQPKVSFDTFEDGWPNIFIEGVKETIEHQEVTYIGDFSTPKDFFQNFAAIRGIIDYYANKVRIILPYFPVGTMERIDTKGQVATARYFADIMSQFPHGRNGKTSVHIFDIHALVERFLFDSHSVNTEIHTALHLLKQEVEGKSIVYPDEGAMKRFQREFPYHDAILFTKVREGEKRILSLKEGNPKGKEVIIIDDLIRSGETLKQAALYLRELGAKKVQAFATHGVFPNHSHQGLAECLDELLVTDTIPANIERAKSINNMRVLSIAPLVEKILMNERE